MARCDALFGVSLHDTYSPQHIQEYAGDPLKNMKPANIERTHRTFDLLGRNAMKLRAAGQAGPLGTDTPQPPLLPRQSPLHAFASRRPHARGPPRAAPA